MLSYGARLSLSFPQRDTKNSRRHSHFIHYRSFGFLGLILATQTLGFYRSDEISLELYSNNILLNEAFMAFHYCCWRARQLLSGEFAHTLLPFCQCKFCASCWFLLFEEVVINPSLNIICLLRLFLKRFYIRLSMELGLFAMPLSFSLTRLPSSLYSDPSYYSTCKVHAMYELYQSTLYIEYCYSLCHNLCSSWRPGPVSHASMQSYLFS